VFSVRQFLAAVGVNGDLPPPTAKPSTDRRLETIIRRHIEAVLLELNGNIGLSAGVLDISRSQLQERLNRWALEDGLDGARCLHCGARRLIKIEGPDGYFKCLRCHSGFSAA